MDWAVTTNVEVVSEKVYTNKSGVQGTLLVLDATRYSGAAQRETYFLFEVDSIPDQVYQIGLERDTDEARKDFDVIVENFVVSE